LIFQAIRGRVVALYVLVALHSSVEVKSKFLFIDGRAVIPIRAKPSGLA